MRTGKRVCGDNGDLNGDDGSTRCGDDVDPEVEVPGVVSTEPTIVDGRMHTDDDVSTAGGRVEVTGDSVVIVGFC